MSTDLVKTSQNIPLPATGTRTRKEAHLQWATVVRNIFSNWTSYLVTAIVGFLLAPFIVHRLGNTGYGLWTLVLSLTGYFGLLDLGIRSSVGRFVARYVALQDESNVNRTVSTAFAMLASGGVLALLATVVAVKFFFGKFHVEPEFESAAKVALLITGLNMASILPCGVFSSVLVALERFDVLSGVTVVGELIRAALVVACLNRGYGLVGLAIVSLLITVCEYGVMAVLAKTLYRPLKLSLRLAGRASFHELFSFSAYRFIWIIANQLIFYSDSVVIGIFLGAGSITYFAIAGSLINYGRNIVSMVTDTLYPAASRMDARQDLAGLRKLLIVGTRLALLICLPLCVGYIVLGRQFIALWMGKAYVSSALYLTVLTIPQFTAMPQYVSALVLSGMAKHKPLAYLIFAEGIANLVLSIVLVRKIGLVGVAWGTTIPDVLCMAVFVPLYTLRTLKMGVREYFVGAWLRPLVCIAPVAVLGYEFYVRVATASWAMFGGEVAAICGVFGLMSYLICLDPEQRAMTRRKVWSFVHREPVGHEA